MAKVEIPDTYSQSDEEYDLIKETFSRFIFNFENSDESWGRFEEIITLRASFLIDRVLTGLKVDLDQVLSILRDHNSFTSDLERRQRVILIAAIDNMVDFATAQEYTMMQELPDEIDRDEIERYSDVCERYNLTYAETENEQVLLAAGVAHWWLRVADDEIVTFMTQGDERVRAWHLSFEGISYSKREFPPELIPPIEWGCRCYLISNGFSSVYGALKKEGKPKINPIFSESLAKGGRIFTSAHPYFSKTIPERLQLIATKIKQKLYG